MPGADNLGEIARQIADAQGTRQELARRLRFNSGKIHYEETLENELHRPVKAVPVEGRVAAVDGGIVGEELHGFDFLLMRTVGAIFDYRGSKPVAHSYHPSAVPRMEYDIRSGLDAHEVMWHKSLFRLKGELSCAREIISQHKPAYLLLDGSIAPLLSDKPSEDSEMHPLYLEVVEAYRELYQAAWKGNCALCGVIKDSRSKRFIEIIGKHSQNEPGLLHTTDTNFLYFLLEAGERTCAFSYSGAPARHQILKDLGDWSGKILSFYLKPVKDDRPLRVEFLSGQKSFDEIASFIHSLSSSHKAYAYPAALIEADMRAALSPDEFDYAYGRLFSKLGGSPSLLKLRRNMRPFR
jgi:hypothetical protein